ncbi:hypothetical protein PV797_08575 [Clostridiaceae bacterium M8S5]|nr:hypothetical protein PV797_08575 [Clostridiaceae bacterium M8S5]
MNNIVGLLLEDALDIIGKEQDNIKIKYTKGLNNKFSDELKEARVVRLDYDKNEILVCYF